MRRTKRIIASLVAAVTVISQVMPMMKVTAATDNVRLATFNIAANKKPDITKLNELLKTNNVDIVGLQEVDINTSRNPYNMLEKFVEQGDYAYSSFQKAIETGGGDYGVALLSNLELINTNGGALSSEGIKEARAWQKGEIEVNGKVIAVYNTHLTYESVEARAKQLLELKATMDQDPAEYKVAFGDFNVDQNHNEIYPFLEDYNIANGKGGKWYDTFNGTDASMKTSAVDNIITSRNLEISNITMVETDLSDHNLFYADAKLLDQPVASRDYLDLVISDANALDEGKYSNASYNTLDEKLVAGELLDQNATQEQINKAVKDIQTAQDNLKTRYPNLALNKDVSVSGLEVNDGRWTAPMAVDGIVSSDSRVSLAKDKDEQWLEVDLGKTETISNFVINYESQVPAFKIQVAGEDKVYRDIYEVSNLEGQISNIQKISIDPTEARYVKYVQLKRWTHSGNGKQYSGSIYEFEVYEQDPDAKDYSNIALNRPVSASSLEVGDGRFTAPMAVDGVVSKDSRVSFGKTADNQWLLVDLGSRKTVSEFVINYESCPPAFKIQVSTDGVNYQDVYEAADLPDGGPSEIKEIQIEATKARYVKYVQLKRWTHTNKNKYSGSIYEFEVYKERDHTVTTADEVLKSLNKEAPQINGNKIVLPAVPDGFEAGALDIREQSSYDVIEAVLDEYLDGPNPVIQSDKFHIGTDEYDKSYSEQMRKWTDHFINYVNDKGYDTRLWGSLGSRGFNGTTPVSNDATVNLWAPYWADVKETYNAGYDIINTCGGWLYIVPGANAGYPDRLDIASLYDKFDVNNFSPSRNAGQGTAIMPIAHPQTKGGQFCVWNDMTSYGGGFTWFDIYDRFIDAVMITSEKTWYGEKTDGQTAAEFVERANKLNSVVPGANPGRVVESKGENITAIDFETIKNGKAVDTSGNNYNATLNNAIIEKANGNNIATVNGDGYVALPYKSIGYPYTVMMDIKLDSNTSENTQIFSGDDGVMYANIDGTGKIGYSRSGYNFTFDYELPKDTWVNLALTCDQKNTTLYINGKAITTGINMGTAINNRKDSSTFVLPVEKILNNAKGSVDNIKIYNKTFSATEISDELGYIQLENLALNKNATASSVNPLTPNLTPNLAVDGDNTKVTTNRWSSKRATGAGTNEGDTEYGTVEQDLTVDLGANYKVDKVFISWEGAYATKYTIQGSLDGVNFFDIKDITNGTGGEITHKDLGDVETRYVRIACHDAKNRNWGYSIYELEVYQSTNEGLRALVKEGQAELAKFDAGNKNGNIAKDDYEVFEQKFEDYLALADGTEISTEEIGKLLKEVTAIINSIEDSVIYSKNELNELYQKVSLYQEKDFTKDSFVDFNTKLTAIKGLIDNADDYIKVNEAMGQLQTLDSSLVKLDRSKLKTAIESYDNFQETDYTTSSWQTMKTIVDAAKLVYENVSLNQVDVDNAIAALNEINLEKRGNTKELAKLLKEYDEADYTISTWAEFAGVYQAANAMVVDNSDVNQEQVDAMVALVREAAMKLLELGNSKDLEKVINKITEAIKDLDQANYDQDSWNKLQTMIKAAKELLDSKDVSQAELDAMLDSLNQVYDALKPIEVKPGEETETPTNKPVTDTSDKSVKTGDDVNLFGYAGLLGIALMGLICRKKFD